jgi:hypothetical protein
LALLAKKSAVLTLIVERWDSLPDAVRAAILELVEKGLTSRTRAQ